MLATGPSFTLIANFDWVAPLQVDTLDQLHDVGRQFNIYLVCRRPKIGLLPKTLRHEASTGEIAGTWRISGAGDFPGSFLSPLVGECEVRERPDRRWLEPVEVIGSGIPPLGADEPLVAPNTLEPADLLKHVADAPRVDFEVLYIGQSQQQPTQGKAPAGKKAKKRARRRAPKFQGAGQGGAQSRLGKGHVRAQQILAENERKEYATWVVLLQLSRPLLISRRGESPLVPNARKDYIDFAEAAMVYHFQPPYNDELRTSFPPTKTSFKRLTEAGATGLGFWLRPEGIGGQLYSKHRAVTYEHRKIYPVTDDDVLDPWKDFLACSCPSELNWTGLPSHAGW